jgi:hypothetical protein
MLKTRYFFKTSIGFFSSFLKTKKKQKFQKIPEAL